MRLSGNWFCEILWFLLFALQKLWRRQLYLFLTVSPCANCLRIQSAAGSYSCSLPSFDVRFGCKLSLLTFRAVSKQLHLMLCNFKPCLLADFFLCRLKGTSLYCNGFSALETGQKMTVGFAANISCNAVIIYTSVYFSALLHCIQSSVNSCYCKILKKRTDPFKNLLCCHGLTGIFYNFRNRLFSRRLTACFFHIFHLFAFWIVDISVVSLYTYCN